MTQELFLCALKESCISFSCRAKIYKNQVQNFILWLAKSQHKLNWRHMVSTVKVREIDLERMKSYELRWGHVSRPWWVYWGHEPSRIKFHTPSRSGFLNQWNWPSPPPLWYWPIHPQYFWPFHLPLRGFNLHCLKKMAMASPEAVDMQNDADSP